LARNVGGVARFRTRPVQLAAQIFVAWRARGPLRGRSWRQCNAMVTSHIGRRHAWCAQASTWCIGLVLLDAGCCCWMPAAASRRSSTRRMLELQRFAAVHLGCRGCLQRLCGNRIALLPVFSLVSEQQQELLLVVWNVREPVERALQRGRSGCDRRRLRRAMRAGVRSCVFLQCTPVASQCMHACVHAIALTQTSGTTAAWVL